MTRTRLVTPDDAHALAELLRTNREYLAPWEPVRSDDYFTVEGQRGVIGAVLTEFARGQTVPHVICDDERVVVGRVTLNNIVRGPFQSCSVGYWLSAGHTGRGLASSAVRAMQRVAFEEMGLHRLEAGTLLHNVASQRVLERTGFERFGMAPAYLKIAGRWQDHVLYQCIYDREA